MATIIDGWIDPIATSPQLMSWVWAQQDVLRFYGIPLGNFSGWFFMIFLFAIVWENLPNWESSWEERKRPRFFS